MAKLLTLAAIQRLKPHPIKRREIADAAANGLYLVIQPEPTGAKTWAYRYRLNGKSAKLTLGAVITLPDGEKEPAAR